MGLWYYAYLPFILPHMGLWYYADTYWPYFIWDYFTILCYTVLGYTILYYIILHYAILYYTILDPLDSLDSLDSRFYWSFGFSRFPILRFSGSTTAGSKINACYKGEHEPYGNSSPRSRFPHHRCTNENTDLTTQVRENNWNRWVDRATDTAYRHCDDVRAPWHDCLTISRVSAAEVSDATHWRYLQHVLPDKVVSATRLPTLTTPLDYLRCNPPR